MWVRFIDGWQNIPIIHRLTYHLSRIVQFRSILIYPLYPRQLSGHCWKVLPRFTCLFFWLNVVQQGSWNRWLWNLEATINNLLSNWFLIRTVVFTLSIGSHHFIIRIHYLELFVPRILHFWWTSTHNVFVLFQELKYLGVLVWFGCLRHVRHDVCVPLTCSCWFRWLLVLLLGYRTHFILLTCHHLVVPGWYVFTLSSLVHIIIVGVFNVHKWFHWIIIRQMLGLTDAGKILKELFVILFLYWFGLLHKLLQLVLLYIHAFFRHVVLVLVNQLVIRNVPLIH